MNEPCSAVGLRGNSGMNDKDLWPIHIIFFGFLIALVILAVKMMFEEILNSPLLLVFVVAIFLVLWLVRQHR
jgi:hypothetical protein